MNIKCLLSHSIWCIVSAQLMIAIVIYIKERGTKF